MEIAIYKGRTIHLLTLPREQFQIIYEASIQGQVICPCCNNQVRLYLGIRHKPHFIHKTNIISDQCEKYMASSDRETPIEETKSEDLTSMEQNGFRIPKSRSIQSVAEVNQDQWKPYTAIKHLPPFKHINPTNNMTMNFNTSLDRSQWKAVTTCEGPLLILAGAGSGKTRVLTTRTAYMIKEKKINPKSIMLVTFTSKAAKEMKHRLLQNGGLTTQQIQAIVSGTFHSIFFRMIMFHEPDKWHQSKLMKWDWQREQIIKEAARELSIDEKEFAFDQALQQIGLWKNSLIFPHDVKPKDQWEERVHYMYKHYEQQKEKRGIFDFDDMLVGCYQLLKNNPAILQLYQERLRYFLIDEFQDINKVQYEIMRMLSVKSQNLCVVGDDDQSIYAFRGSDPTFILEFDKDFPTAQIVTLSQNYRSTHGIVVSANKVISKNSRRREKSMDAFFDNEHKPIFFFPFEEEEEATMIVTDIKEHIEKGAKPSDFAILYRTHSSSRAIFERLSQSSLPFKIDQDTDSFYHKKMVKSLLAYLRLSINPNHTEAMNDLVISLFLKQSSLNDIKASSILNDCSLVEALEEITNIHAFQQRKLKKIVPLFASLQTLKPLDAINKIEKEMGFDDYIKKRGNEGNVIEKGSDEIRDLKVVARKFESVLDFLDHIDHMIAMNKEMKQMSKYFDDAVQLTTIHRSKGLEYKHVYVIGAVDGGLPHDYALESFRNGDHTPLEEERRLMYVAMTRAQHTLYMSVPETRRGKKANPSRFIKHLTL